LLALSPAVCAQDPLSTFSRLFREAVDLAVKVSEPEVPQQRAAAATAALARFQQAAAVIPRLPPERRDKARFWVDVWRAEVHWRHGKRAAAAQQARVARQEARGAAVYQSYYRLQCLMILWQCDTAFMGLLDDPQYGDRAYLFGDQPEKDLKGRNTDLIWPLRLMRCDLRLVEDELWAVDELRKIDAALQATNDPDVAGWQQLCVKMLARHYMELRDWARAQLFVDQLPKDSEDSQKAQIRIARARQDFDTVIRLGRKLGRRNDAYHLFVAEALEDAHRYREALTELVKVFQVPDLVRESRAAALNVQADCYLGLARQDEAKRDAHLNAAAKALQDAWDALDGVNSYQARAERAEIHKDQGRVLELMEEPRKAFLKFTESIDQLEQARASIPLDLLGISFLGQEAEHLAAVDGVLRTYSDAGRSITDALVVMDRLKSRDLLDWLAQRPSPENLARYRRALRDVALGTDPDDIHKRNQTLDRLRAAEGDRRRSQSIQGSMEMNRLLSGFPDTCFLCYWAGEERVYLVAVTTGPESTRCLVDLGERGKALRLVADAHTQVSAPESQPWQALDAAAEFFLLAAQPLLAEVERVVVCPGADLHRLPFAALRIEGKALGTTKELVTVPSLAVLRELSTRRGGGDGLVVVHSATPPAAQSQLLHLGPLKFSEHEANLVADNYHVLATMQGPVATFPNLRTVLVAHAGRVGVVHLSAHAVENVNLASRSLLMLSDGPADMASMAALELKGSLVVLSSCLSRGAAERGGEGVNGLIWGPLAAGARAVVASQWNVGQQATADLMSQFHYFRSRGHNDADAMRQARQRLSTAANYEHPYYWAAFNVVAAPVRPAGGAYWWVLAAAVAGLAALYLLLRRK
jgi:CHAT domain-containing protein